VTAATDRSGQPPDLARIVRVFDAIPHCQALGLAIIDLRYGHVLARLPYDERLIGNPATRVIHGGAITAFLDTCSGLAVMASVADDTPIATLDLRIDYLRPAAAGRDILASAECYKVTAHVAFVRGLAYQDTFRNPVANCVGTFMLGASGFSADRAGSGDGRAG